MPGERGQSEVRGGRSAAWDAQPQQRGLYDDPALYDILHTPGTAGEVDGLERIEERFAQGERAGRRRWLEPACGSGRYLRVACGRGIDVTGLDISAPMIEYARERMPTGRAAGRVGLHVAAMERFVPPVDPGAHSLAFNLINTIRHLDSDRAMLAHLEQVALALRPGGVYAVGVSITDYDYEQPTEDTWSATRGGVRIVQNVQYIPPEQPETRLERVISVLSVTTSTGERQFEGAYTLRTYDASQWRGLIERSAMRTVACVDERGDRIAEPRLGYGIFVLELR